MRSGATTTEMHKSPFFLCFQFFDLTGAAALAAYAATTTIPIVFVTGVDPVTSGLVMGLNRPGRNATGVYIFQQVLEGKRLGLLRELVPAAVLIAVLLNPTNANFQTQLRGVQDAARDLGQQHPECKYRT